MTRAVRLLLVVLGASLMLSACSFDVYKLPLPGGTSVGSDPITVTAQFDDVLDLVPKSTVKVNDVSVGEVTSVKLDGYHAVVTMKLRNSTKLPDNAIAEIQQTSLLGEKFIALSAPTQDASSNPLSNGDVIPLSRTGRNPEVEEVLGALSLLLNGGGVAQLKTIAQEINQTLTGREDPARDVLTQIQTLTSTLDQNKGDIVNAIEALDRLSRSVRVQQGNIDEALDELPSALRSIDAQRKDLVTMLQALARLGNVGVRVIKASKQATIDSLTQLQPVVTELADSGDNLVKAFNDFYAYPFIDEVVGRDPQVARNLHVGDYTNLSVQLDLDFSQAINTSLPTVIDPTAIVGLLEQCIQSGDLASEACQKVLALPNGLAQLKQECQKPENSGSSFCQALNMIPGLPTSGPNGGGGSSGGPTLPTLPTSLPSLPGGLPSIPGLGRAGALTSAAGGNPTMGELASLFDPTLVDLLVPPLVTSTAPPGHQAGQHQAAQPAGGQTP